MNKLAKWGLLIGVAASCLWAAPSVNGINGLINMPTAYSINPKEVDVGFNLVNSSTSQPNLKYYSNLGVFDGVELGFIGNNVNEGVFINLKFFMVSDRNSISPLRIAGGFTNISSHSNTDLFLVLSKSFSRQVAGHFGFTSNVSASNIKANVMFGMEMGLNPDATIVADMVGEGSTWDLAAGVRYKLSNEFQVNAYLDDIGNNTAKKSSILVGMAWFGLLQ
jgi:hypothetical protein